MSYLAKKYESLDAYVPGEQPRDRKYIKLNTNESPYPPSEKVLGAIKTADVESLRLYCDPEATILRDKLAEYYGVERKNVFVSNGSDDVLNFSFMAYAADKGAAFADITYGFYKVFCALHEIDAKIIPLADDFSVNADDYIGLDRFIAIANPNAPTGLSLPTSEVERILLGNPESVVLIDEAYVDFGGEEAIPLIKKYKNLIVTGTYSKSRSMAGARLGFAIADEELIKGLEKLKYSTNPYDVNALTQILGAATIDDAEYYKDKCRRIIETRESFTQAIVPLGFSVLPSKTNFVFAKHESISGDEIYSELRKRGILVRHFTGERIREYNRITIGTPEDMQAVVNALVEITKNN